VNAGCAEDFEFRESDIREAKASEGVAEFPGIQGQVRLWSDDEVLVVLGADAQRRIVVARIGSRVSYERALELVGSYRCKAIRAPSPDLKKPAPPLPGSNHMRTWGRSIPVRMFGDAA
jgi:hypothetical protein